jgi:hypothetical protein
MQALTSDWLAARSVDAGGAGGNLGGSCSVRQQGGHAEGDQALAGVGGILEAFMVRLLMDLDR